MTDGVGMIRTDARVRTVDGSLLHGEVRLPGIAGAEPVRDPAVDTIGRLVGTHPLLTFGAAGAGLLLGASGHGTRGVGGRVLGGLVGAGLGVLGAMALTRGAELVSGRGSAIRAADVRTPVPVADTPRVGAADEQLRIMDWNVRELIGSDGMFRTDDGGIDAVASVVARERPDVLVLQEVSQLSALGGFADDLDELAARLGATDAVLVPNGLRGSGKAKGQAVLTFGDARIQDARGLRHPDPLGDGVERRLRGALGPLTHVGVDLPAWMRPTYQPRTTADVVVTTEGGTDVRVVDVHLSGSSGSSAPATTVGSRQLQAVVDTLDDWHGATIVSGDFNTRAGTPHHAHERSLLEGAGLRGGFEQVGIRPDHPDTRSFPSTTPDRSIDRLYASGDVRVTGARVLDDPVARAGSDHLPLVFDVVVD